MIVRKEPLQDSNLHLKTDLASTIKSIVQDVVPAMSDKQSDTCARD